MPWKPLSIQCEPVSFCQEVADFQAISSRHSDRAKKLDYVCFKVSSGH